MEAEGITITPKQREDVERQLRRTDLTRRMRERLEMVKAAALGDDVERIARWSGRSVETVEHWLARLPRVGWRRWRDASRSGRPVRADEAYLAAMEAALESGPSPLGLAFDVWTSERLSLYLEQQTGATSRRAGCGALGAARLDLWTAQAHALAPARPRRRRRLEGRGGGGGGKRCARSRSATAAFPGRDASGDQSVPLPDMTSAGANNRRYRGSGPIDASRCVAASRR